MEPEILFSMRLAADSAMAALIWLVQLVIYPAFNAIEPDRFRRWHHHYMHAISFLVIPLMLLQAGCAAMQCALAFTPAVGVASAGIAVAWLTTFTLSVPCHRRLQSHGRQADVISRLVCTNWIRTIAWTAVLAAGLSAGLSRY